MAVTGISANRLELLQIADAVAREKNIDREIVIEAIEEAIQKGAKSRYGAHHDIRAKIDHKTGELSLPGAFERDRLLGLELVEGALDGAWGMITPAGAPLLPKRPLLKTKASRSRKAPLAVPHAA